MRYRPFARTGMAVSVLSMELNGEDDRRKPNDWRELVHAGFEEGINAFEIVEPSPALLDGFAEAAEAVKRQLLFVAMRAPAAIEGPRLAPWVEQAIVRMRLEYIDILTLGAGPGRTEELLAAAILLKDADRVWRLGVAGSGELIDGDGDLSLFDAIFTPFNLLSGWRDRNLVRRSLEQQIGCVACDPCPAALEALIETAEAQTKPGWFKRAKPLAGAGTYAFLASTHGWTTEQICLAYALTEPAVTTVQMPATSRKHLAALAAVTDRDLPSQVSAQIEMARFSAEEEARKAAARRRA